MNALRRHAPYAEHRLESVCARTKMRYFAQIFQSVPLLLQGICGRRRSGYLHFIRLYFKRLLVFGSVDNCALCIYCRADVQRGYFFIINQTRFHDYLGSLEKRAVGNLHKGKRFSCADGSHPAAYADAFAVHLRTVAVQLLYACNLHILPPTLQSNVDYT